MVFIGITNIIIILYYFKERKRSMLTYLEIQLILNSNFFVSEGPVDTSKDFEDILRNIEK